VVRIRRIRMDENKSVVKRNEAGLVDPSALAGWAEVFRKSGLFAAEGNPEVQVAQAQVKILAGLEMGLPAFFAMQNLYIVKNHVFVSAAAFGALVNGGKDTKFITKQSDVDKAVIEFYRKVDDEGEWELVHTQVYTWDDVPANRRSQATYQSDRADMIWNRCMTKGAKKACPEKVGGMRSVEEAQDEGTEFKAELIPETAKKPEAPHEALPAGASDTEPGAAPAEQKVEDKPRRHRKPAESSPVVAEESKVVESPAPEPEQAKADEKAFTPDASAAADANDNLVTDTEVDQLRVWILTYKFPASDNLKKHGITVKKGSELTMGQFAALRIDYEAYMKAACAEFGWDYKPAMVLNEAQVERIQKRGQKK
jgi:hypothetical protein